MRPNTNFKLLIGFLSVMLFVNCSSSDTQKIKNSGPKVTEYISIDTIDYAIQFKIPNGYRIEFVDSVIPTDEDVVLCVAAAFSKNYSFEKFTSDQVANDYVTYGKYKAGYNCPISMTGNFCYFNGTGVISKGKSKELIDSALNHKGSYFQQNLAIYNYEIEQKIAFSAENRKIKTPYRFLCELDDNSFAITEVRGLDYISALKFLILKKVKKALYLDMGTWRYGYYRTSEGVYEINSNVKLDSITPNNFQTNWIIVRR